jgi:hypothetical protein
VHHNIPQEEAKRRGELYLINAETNLITLCRGKMLSGGCHLCFGHRGNFKDWNEKAIEQARANGRAPWLGGRHVMRTIGNIAVESTANAVNVTAKEGARP